MNWPGTFTGCGMGVALLLFWAFIGYLVGDYKGNGDYVKSLDWCFATEIIGLAFSTALIVGIALLVR